MVKLIGFTGTMGAGKSTAIETLLESDLTVGHYNIKFAQPLYDIQELVYKRIERTYQRPDSFVKDRKLLQWLGTDWGRDTIRESIWVDLWQEEVKYAQENYSWATITCDDVRFDNEADRFKSLGGVLIKLVRDNTNVLHGGVSNHKSEAGVNSKFIDFTVENNGTLEQFKSSLTKVYQEILGSQSRR